MTETHGRLVPFRKVQSIGNDFVLVAWRDLPEDPAPFVREICARRFGVGSDGLLAYLVEGDTVRQRMWNPDGTEDFCGNGLRCTAVALAQAGEIPSRFEFVHGGQRIPCRVVGLEAVLVLPPEAWEPRLVPHARQDEWFAQPLALPGGETVEGSALSTGSTHCVILADPGPDFERLSRAIEMHADFPQRTSVIWVTEVTADRIRVRIWERGVGETLGCGTGAAAAVAVIWRHQGQEAPIRVDSPGGSLCIARDADGGLRSTGTAQVVFRGDFASNVNF